MNWTRLFPSNAWLLFSLSLCLALSAKSHSRMKNITAPKNLGGKEVPGLLLKTLLNNPIVSENLAFKHQEQNLDQRKSNFASDNIKRHRESNLEASISRETGANKRENKTSVVPPNASRTRLSTKDLDFSKQPPQIFVHPSARNRVRSPRSVHYASEYTETAELGMEHSNLDTLVTHTDDEESSYGDSDSDYTDDVFDRENDQLESAQISPPEYMVYLFHMLQGTHIEMLKDAVVTSFANVKHEAPIVDTYGLTKYRLAFRTHFPDDRKLPQHTELRVFLEIEEPAKNEESSEGGPIKETCVHIDVFERVSAKSRSSYKDGNSHDGGKDGDTSKTNINNNAFNNSSRFSSNNNKSSRRGPSAWVIMASKDVNVSKSRWEGIEMLTDTPSLQRSKQRVFELRVHQCRDFKGDASEKEATTILNEQQQKDFIIATERPKVRIVSDLTSEHDAIFVVFSKKKAKAKPTFPTHPGSRLKRDTFTFHEDKTSVSTTSRESFLEKGYVLRQTTKKSFDFITSDEENIRDRQIHKAIDNTRFDLGKDNVELSNDEKIHGLNNIKSLKELAKILDATSTLSKNDEWETIFESINTDAIPRREIIHNIHNLSQVDVEKKLKNIKIEGTLSKRLQLKIKGNRGNNTRNAHAEASHHAINRDTNEANSQHRRSERSARRKKNPCRRVPMYVDFTKIAWNHLFAYPEGYQAFQCKGRCYMPIADYLTPTMHAVIQTRLHTISRRLAQRACCVPTKLSPISVIQTTKDGDYDYHYSYDEMVVEECGCR